MKEKIDLEPYQYQDIYNTEDEPFLASKQGLLKHLLYFSVLMLALIIFLSFFIVIPREISLAIEIKGGGKEIIGQYPDDVYIIKKFIKSNERVLPGDKIMMIYSEKIVSFIGEIASLKSEIDFHRTQRQDRHQADVNLLNKQRESITKRLELLSEKISQHKRSLDKTNKIFKQQIDIQEKSYKRSVALNKKHLLSKEQLEKAHQQLISKRQESFTATDYLETKITDFQQEARQLNSRIVSIEKEIDQIEIVNSNNLVNLERRLDLIYNNIEINYGKNQIMGRELILLAPREGKISLVNDSELKIPSGEILWRLQVSDDEFYAYAETASKHIGVLSTDQVSILKLDSFPHYHYGTIKAKIDQLSNSPNSLGNYPITFNIIESNGFRGTLTKGMRGKASIKVEEKSIARHLTSSFYREVINN